MTGPAERERLDRGIHWDELAGIVEDAYAEVAPRSWSRLPGSAVRNCAY